MLNNFSEILLSDLSGRNMFKTGKTYDTCGINPFFIGILRRNEAVCSHKDRPVKAFKFLILSPPRVSVIPCKMAVFLESRVVIGRKHFPVRIDIDARTFGLLQQLFHILKVMAAYQYTGLFLPMLTCNFRVPYEDVFALSKSAIASTPNFPVSITKATRSSAVRLSSRVAASASA